MSPPLTPRRRPMPRPVTPRAGAPAVVLAGGVGVPARKWAGVVAELDDAHVPPGRRITWVIADRPGLGRRRGHRLGDVPDFADEVGRIVHDLRRCRDAGASPVILAAHSAAGFLAEGAVRANPGLVDGVLLLDVSVVEDAGRPMAPFERASHAVGLLLEPLVRWAWPRMRRGELSSLLLENAAFSRWARDLRALRDQREVPEVRAPRSVAAVTDVVAVPERQLRGAGGVGGEGRAGGEDGAGEIAAVVAALPGRQAHLRIWGDLAGGPGGGADALEEVILAPCPHMVMSHRPGDVAAEITALISRTTPGGPA